ncbi:hypothetical protein HK096_001450, partial [Nowakowskiella sp. JEL0078]
MEGTGSEILLIKKQIALTLDFDLMLKIIDESYLWTLNKTSQISDENDEMHL